MNLSASNKLNVWVWLAVIPLAFFGLQMFYFKTTGHVPTFLGALYELFVFPLLGLGMACIIMAVKALASHPDRRQILNATIILLLCIATAATFLLKYY